MCLIMTDSSIVVCAESCDDMRYESLIIISRDCRTFQKTINKIHLTELVGLMLVTFSYGFNIA